MSLSVQRQPASPYVVFQVKSFVPQVLFEEAVDAELKRERILSGWSAPQ
jgi:hypothetical protein